MPPKSGKEKDKKKVLKGSGKAPGDVVKALLLDYEAKCKAEKQQILVPVRNLMKKCIDEEKLLAKVTLEQRLRSPPEVKKVVEKKKPRPRGGFGMLRQKSAFTLGRLPAENDKWPISVAPLLEAVRAQRYLNLKDIYIWGVLMPHAHVALLSDLLEKGAYPVRTLSLQDCMLGAHSLARLGSAVTGCPTMQTLELDYNEFGDLGCTSLCEALLHDCHLLTVSLCYCALSSKSGVFLARMVCSTALRNLYLNGNDLDTQGVSDLVQPLLDYAVSKNEQKLLLAQQKESIEQQAMLDPSGGLTEASRALSAASQSKSGAKKRGKRNRKKKSAKKPAPLIPGPWIYKLHLADNGIHYKKNPIKDRGLIDTVACMNLLAKFLAVADELRELDLEDNWISDSGARDLLEGLKTRKDSKLPKVSVKINCEVDDTLFTEICKIGQGSTLKKRGGKRKKK